jgi:hypothetical protein
MNVATSKFCPSADKSLNTLENNYTLTQIFKLREYIDICEAMEEAYTIDNQNTN